MVTTYHYSLLSILWWNILGQWMNYVFKKVRSDYFRGHLLPYFYSGAPGWWLEVHEYEWLWSNHLTDAKPDYWFKEYYIEAAQHHLAGWIADKARGIATPLVNAVSNLLGSVLHSYLTFSDWIEAIRYRVGTYVPWWATSLANAATKLRNWLPDSIPAAIQTWDGIWEGIKTAVKNWAKIRFDTAMTWVANTAPWLVAGYQTVRAWYDLVAAWVTNFKNDPYGTVAGLLGVAWTYWLTIRDDIADFYNHVWVPFKVDVHAFFDHPVLWLYDRFEEEAENHIETLSRWVGRIAEKIILWAW